MTETSRLDVAVVLATRDRAERLQRTLDALGAQDFERDFELIVVDDASADETPELLAERVAASLPERLRVIRRDTPGGPAGARNTGWRDARAPLVAFTDDDCEPTAGWLSGLVRAATAAPGGFVQGPTSPHPDELDRLGPFSRTLDVRELGPWFPTANMAYPRTLLERLDGFDETLPRGEDTDLAWRAMELGAEPAWAESALVHHAVMDLGALEKLRLATRWRLAFANFTRHPGLREHLTFGVFWKRSHALMLLALVGLSVAKRFPPALVLAVPYARDVRRRMAHERAPLSLAGYYPLHDGVETATALAGSLPRGTLVL